ncbi:thyrotropin releasing hormone [Thomomys bottae]
MATPPCPPPWLLALALISTLASVPRGRAQPEAPQEEAAMAGEHPGGLDDLQRQSERLLLLREDLHRLRGDLDQLSKSLVLRKLDWLSKRQHPGKREEAEEGVEAEEEEMGAVGPHKRQHPGRRQDEEAEWPGLTQHKRQHPGRRSPWLQYALPKRQHPGRRLVDPKVPRSWEEEEEEEGEGEGALIPEKRQHPGKRTLGDPCGPRGACGQAGLLLGLLDGLSRDQGEQEHPNPPRWAAWAREPLE